MSYKISVALASYNGEKFIEAQLDSIIQQLPLDAELIISDDGSTDTTLDIIKRYEEKDARVRLIFGNGKGPLANFENAMKSCSGDIIFLADQDDVWMDNKIEQVLAIFEKDKNVSLVIHDAVVTNGDLTEIIYPSFFEFRGSKKGLFHNWLKNSYMGCCMAFRKDVRDISIPIPRQLPMHDQWIGMLSEKCIGENVFLKIPLLQYRRHGSNASDFKKDSLRQMITKRIHLLHLLRQYRKR